LLLISSIYITGAYFNWITTDLADGLPEAAHILPKPARAPRKKSFSFGFLEKDNHSIIL
jgi:hypothetical protein